MRSSEVVVRAFHNPKVENWRLKAWNRFLTDFDLTEREQAIVQFACKHDPYEDVRTLYDHYDDTDE